MEPRRPVRPGLRRRPAGRRPRGPQPVAHRLRPGRDPLVADGLRADVEDHDAAGDAAQPHGLQGRHGQHPGRGSRGARPARLGPDRREPAWLAGGTLPGRPQDRDADRDRGTGSASPSRRRSSGGPRAPGAPLSGGDEFTAPDFAASADGDARPSMPPPTSGSPTRRPTAGSRILRRGYNYVDGNNALRPAGRRPVLPLLPALPEPVHHAAARAGDRRPERVHPPRGSAVFAVPPGASTGRLRRRDAVRLT